MKLIDIVPRDNKRSCSAYIAAVNKHNHNWNLKRHEQTGKAADAFIKQHCLIMTYGKDPTNPVMDFLQWRKALN